MYTVLMLAAIAAAGYGFVTKSPTLALMAWIGSGGFLAFALGLKEQPKLEWVRPIQLRPFFSAKVFLLTLLVSAAWTGLPITHRTSGNFSQASFQMGLIMLIVTVPFVMLAVFSVASGEWQPDPRPWKDRAYASGQTWVSMALAIVTVNITLLLL